MLPVSGLFYLTQCSQDLSALLEMTETSIFIISDATSLYVYIAFTTYHIPALIDTVGQSCILAIMKDHCMNVAMQTTFTQLFRSSS